MSLSTVFGYFSRLFEISKLVGALRPLIASIVDDIEDLFPEGGKGAEKLAWAKDAISKFFDSLQNVSVTFEQAWPTIQALIAALVTIRNAAGLFKSSKS